MIGDPLCGHQHDAGTLDCPLRGGPLAHGLFKVLSLLIGQCNFQCFGKRHLQTLP
jgi:hypothetical protein